MSPGKKTVSKIIGVYVDDSVVTGGPDVCKSLREHSEECFPTRKLGALSYILGCEHVRDCEKINLRVSQTACTD